LEIWNEELNSIAKKNRGTSSIQLNILILQLTVYRFEDDQGPPATEQGRATREASPPPKTARVQELPRSISWADEMEEEYELNGPPPDLEPGEVSWAVQDHDNASRETDASRRGQPGTAGRPA
jgi:hypothetical protein